jgi:hypothetical protein
MELLGPTKTESKLLFMSPSLNQYILAVDAMKAGILKKDKKDIL